MAEIYKQNTWVDNETILNADNMNHIEQGIKNNNNEILDIEEKLERDLPESGISGSKIQDGTITEEKLSEDLNDKITNGTRVIFNVLAVADNASGTNTDNTITITEALNKDTPVSDINNSFIAFKANFTGTENSYITGTLTLTKTVESTTTTVVYNLPNIQLGENEVEINLALTAEDPSSGTLEDFFTANFNDATYSYTISGTIQEYSSGENYTLEISGLTIVEIGKLVDYVKKTDYATAANPGLIKPGQGLNVLATGELRVSKASEGAVQDGAASYNPIVPYNQHLSVFYGLAKVAGVDASDTDYKTALGSYTDEAKAAIQNMIGLGDGSITNAKLAQYAVETSKIADGAVTANKLSSSFYETGTFKYICLTDGASTIDCKYIKIGTIVTIIGALKIDSPSQSQLWSNGLRFVPESQYTNIVNRIKPTETIPFAWMSTTSQGYKGNGYISSSGDLYGDNGPAWGLFSPSSSDDVDHISGLFTDAHFTVTYII